MLFNLHKNQIIYPCENKQLNFWAKKWGVKADQLNEAIIQTGSINRTVIKNYLERKGVIFSLSGAVRSLRDKIRLLADKFVEDDDDTV